MKSKKSTFSTDKEIKALKPKDKEFALTDTYTQGLQLIVRVDGGKQWAFRYSSPILKDKQNKPHRRRIGLGTYPIVSLIEARNKANELKKEISQGIDPLELKREIKEQIITDDKSQFHKVVFAWLDTLTSMQQSTKKKETSRLENHILKYFSIYDEQGKIAKSTSIKDISMSEISTILSNLSKEKAETADRLYGYCNRIWLYAISLGYTNYNIMQNISKKDTLSKVNTKHYPKITDEKILIELLRSIDNYNNSLSVKLALKLLCHLPIRAKTFQGLKWEQVDFENKIITIPRSDMKTKDSNLSDFVIPLSSQALELLNQCKNLFGHSAYVLPSPLNQNHHINSESLNKALKVMGYGVEPKKQTVHSFRGTFRSLVDTNLHLHNMPYEIREAVLDHHEKNMAVRAYTHKANHLEQMRKLLQWWSDYLDSLKTVAS
ncbi:MAG: integrase arm-type DNA-binding domain-containing protein [Epsilonproteobacteria bacterium]|nr:integrase arm-type DNA-binding domain-containing protein [Campylobacterota bacterium]